MIGGTRLWLLRHAETEWSLSGQHTSFTDIPLTPNGEAMGRLLGRSLAGKSFSLVMSSPRQRALRTCELAGLLPQAEVTEDLAEWNYGQYEGRTTKEIRKESPAWTIWNGHTPGGETPDEVGARCQRVIERAKEAGGDVALFAHGHVLRVMAATWLGLQPSEGRCFTLGTGTYSVLGYEHEYTTTLVWNQSVQAVVEAIE
ncbi:MAG: histidine phosphatase family protein [Phycisphaerae bacterium]|nr:histidine phosphatase family protein [Phycisphaerae bacterium]